jgi:DNA processing protein
MLSREELAAWLRLGTTPGISRGTARQLLAAFGSAERVLAADESTLRSLVGSDVVHVLKRIDPVDEAGLAATTRWLGTATTAARDLVVLGDPRYPMALLQTADPPLLLFTLGRVELLSTPSVAIVGSRKASPQGCENAHYFAQFLSERQLTIVSGLAMGIDAAAHEGGLAGAGSTVAFVGTGLDRVYPARNRDLMWRIGDEGLVASEYPLGAVPLPDNFPRRNRLIAGLSQGTLVVEAALGSGSLITARMALECGRDVFAIPGSIHSPQSQGCHRLIQEGAKLVECGDDVLRELRVEPREGTQAARMSPRQPSLFAAMAADVGTDDAAAPDAALKAALGHDPVTFDALAARTGMASDQLAARLLELELSGVVRRLPGGLLQRRATA